MPSTRDSLGLEMLATFREYFSQWHAHGLVAEVFSLGGFLLAVFLVARLMSEKRAPANTFAWLLIIVLLPWVGVPLYLIFGGRKLRRLAARKARLVATLPGHPSPSPSAELPVGRTVTAAGAYPPVGGNHLQLLTTGEADFAELERQIRAARHTIHIATFILSRDETGRHLVQLLAERARAGVKVRLLLDALGCFISSRGFVDPLRAAGGEVGRFMPVLPFTSRSSANLRNHRKLALFDGHTALVGGRNLAHDYMGAVFSRQRWLDFGAVITGPAVELLENIFIADWCFATRQSTAPIRREAPVSAAAPAGVTELQIVASGPDMPGDALYEGIISMIQEAERSICIVTPYFIPDDVLLRSLIVKTRAGCAVTLILPAKSNHPITDFARRHYVRELQRAGARVLLYRTTMLHAKTVIVDSRIGLLGSANFDLRSLFVNFELGIFVHSATDVAAMAAWADELSTRCHESKPEPYRRQKFFGNLAEDLSRLFAPLL
jgi:cardiolipin synthase